MTFGYLAGKHAGRVLSRISDPDGAISVAAQ
jgi:hypothetical protein